MTEAEQRAAVVELTRKWIDTPYVHEGRIQNKCADCTFFAVVFEQAGLIPHVDIPHYAPQAHINRGSAPYLHLVQQYSKREISEAEVQPADVVMYHIGRTFSHGAVVIDWPWVIHADASAGKVVRSIGDQGRLMHPRRFFSFW